LLKLTINGSNPDDVPFRIQDEAARPFHLPGCKYTSVKMNITPTSVAMPKVRTSHWRVLTGSFLLRGLRITDALCFFLHTTNTCRMNE